MLAVAPRKALLLTTGHIALLRASAAAADDYHSQWRVRIGEVQSVKGAAASPAVDRLLSARQCPPVCCQRLESCGSGHCKLKFKSPNLDSRPDAVHPPLIPPFYVCSLARSSSCGSPCIAAYVPCFPLLSRQRWMAFVDRSRENGIPSCDHPTMQCTTI